MDSFWKLKDNSYAVDIGLTTSYIIKLRNKHLFLIEHLHVQWKCKDDKWFHKVTVRYNEKVNTVCAMCSLFDVISIKSLYLPALLQKVVSHAEMLWERMKDRGDKEFPMTHDG